MSGLEALAALGIACSIFQTITFGCDTIRLVKQVYQGGTLDDAVYTYASELHTIADSIRATHPKTASARTLSPRDKNLLKISEKCCAVARDLQEEVKFIVGHAQKGSLRTTLKVAAKANWRKRRLDRMEADLYRAESLLQTGLLDQVCTRVGTMSLQMESIESRLETFLQRYNEGHRTSSKLITKESIKVQKHVTAESEKTELAIRQHITHEVSKSEGQVKRGIVTGIEGLKEDEASRTQCERLMASLKYARMNERLNQVGESFSTTFDWIFAADGDENRPTTRSFIDDDQPLPSGPDAIDPNEGDSSDAESLATASSSESTIGSHDEDADSDGESEDPPNIVWDCFSDWLMSNDTVYWISGKPGSGKTTLVKHVLAHPLTEKCLAVWKSDSRIISHFFWRPGTSMQQSIRGMLSSLLYQLLEAQPTYIHAVLSNIHGASSKDADTDWSVQNLRETLVYIMKTYQKPLCIFLDGLDEIHPDDGVDYLMELMGEWEQARTGLIKFCLSSRPEPLIQQQLRPYPHLRLEDLVKGDLEKYAVAHLKLPKDDIMYKDIKKYDISIKSLVEKAEGVFLWLCLAIKDLNKGFKKGDEPSDLERRINRLHGDIEGLYNDMWSRMNDDEEIYQETAALYFKLMVTVRLMKYPRDLTVFDILLCSSEIANEALDHESEFHYSPEDLLAVCRQIEKRVQVKCAGLVELFENEYKEERKITSWTGESYNCLSRYIFETNVFQFIHRTAFDFLVDTLNGQKILGHNKSSETELYFRLIKADLATCAMFSITSPHGQNSIIDEMRFGTYDSRLLAFKHNTDNHFRVIEQMDFYTRMDQSSEISWREKSRTISSWQEKLWLYCEKLFESGKLYAPHVMKPRRFYDKHWELLYYAAYHNLMSYILFKLGATELSRPLKSQLLLNMLFGDRGFDVSYLSLVLSLVEAGANPNMASSFLEYRLKFYQLETPWTLFLARALGGDKNQRYNCEAALYAFIKHGAAPGAEVYLYFCIRHYMQEDHWSLCVDGITRLGLYHNTDVCENVFSGIVVLDALTCVQEICQDSTWNAGDGVYELVEALKRENAPTSHHSRMRVVALMEDDHVFARPGVQFKAVSPKDSEYLLEILQPAIFRTEGVDNARREGFASRCQDVFERSPTGESDIYDHLKMLGYLAEGVYEGDNNVDNPWKQNSRGPGLDEGVWA